MPERRLAAIMFTDIVGYTALMSSDEKKAFEILNTNRKIQQNYIEKYDGELFKEMGDGILACFYTASDAVRSAHEIQTSAKKKGIRLRIGIHEGEVVFEKKDVLGDGVNIASRLEELAEEGCIYVSDSVYRDIRNKEGIYTDFVKEELLKNVPDPIKIYKVNCEDLMEAIENKENSTIPQTNEKSIIVLPFENMSPDPDQEYFSDGLTEEIITDLSCIKELRVISRSSAMTFKGKKKKIGEVTREVKVRYVLEGSVRKAGNNLRITAQLIDGKDDSHLWAEKYSGTLDDIFSIQESVSRSIADALEMKLSKKEVEDICACPIDDAKVYEYYIKAKHEINTFTDEGMNNAIQLLESGLKIIGENAVLYAGLSYAYWGYFNIKAQKKYLDKGMEYANRALEIDPESSEVQHVNGMMYFFHGFPGKSRNINKGRFHLKKALQIDPNNSEAMHHLEVFYLFNGKTEAAIPVIEKHISIDPLHFMVHWAVSMYHTFQGRFQEAVEPAEKAYNLVPEGHPIRVFYGLVLAYNNRLDEAFSVFDQIKKVNPENVFSKIGIILKYALQGKKKEALASLTQEMLNWAQVDYTNPWMFIVGYSLIGEKEEALNWLETQIDLGCRNYPFINEHDIFLENIRGEKRFKELMERIKPEWESFQV
jgi:TolB-like protein/class 3 adenylate cyclase/Tfp pilus assembly protein PilF